MKIFDEGKLNEALQLPDEQLQLRQFPKMDLVVRGGGRMFASRYTFDLAAPLRTYLPPNNIYIKACAPGKIPGAAGNFLLSPSALARRSAASHQSLRPWHDGEQSHRISLALNPGIDKRFHHHITKIFLGFSEL